MALYYLTFGTTKEFDDMQLDVSLAANQKINYIINKLNALQKEFGAISLAPTKSKRLHFYKGRTVPCGSHGKYTIWSMFGRPNWLLRIIRRYFRLYQFYRFLSSLSSEDVVIVYHSLFYAEILYKLHKKKKFKLILEIEEIYQDIVKCSKKMAFYEQQLIQSADKYILVANTLTLMIPKGRPYIIFNGTYQTEPVINTSTQDGKIHCVYAGNCNAIKGGAYAAIEAAKFLPKNYHIHILGTGLREEINLLKTQITQLQSQLRCTLTFDGLKTGNEFIAFLQQCHIGLSTQNPNEKYVQSSFPSKILVYLANGLRSISARIPAVETSSIGDLLTYYDNQTPQEIARAIMSINLTEPYDSRIRLQQLDQKFQQDLKQLLEHCNIGNI